jgi:Rrf2 family protein
LRPFALNGVNSSVEYKRQMKLGRESEYAIEGLLALAKKPLGTTMLLRDIAVSGKTPESFLSKIFQKLARAGVLQSSRGAIRGYSLARRAKDIKLKEIFLAVEGANLFDRCIFWSDRCADADPCPMHARWKPVRQQVMEMMEKTTLADLLRGRPRESAKG